MAHLRKGADGHLMRNAAGHLVKVACCRYCDDGDYEQYQATFSGIVVPTIGTCYEDSWGTASSGKLLSFTDSVNAIWILSRISECAWRYYEPGNFGTIRRWTNTTCAGDGSDTNLTSIIINLSKVSATIWDLYFTYNTTGVQLLVFEEIPSSSVASGKCDTFSCDNYFDGPKSGSADLYCGSGSVSIVGL